MYSLISTHDIMQRIRKDWNLLHYCNNHIQPLCCLIIHRSMLSPTLARSRASSVATEQMAAILRCKQPATEAGRARGRNGTKGEAAANAEMIRAARCRLRFDCDFTTAITFPLIMQRNKQRSYRGRSQASWTSAVLMPLTLSVVSLTDSVWECKCPQWMRALTVNLHPKCWCLFAGSHTSMLCFCLHWTSKGWMQSCRTDSYPDLLSRATSQRPKSNIGVIWSHLVCLDGSSSKLCFSVRISADVLLSVLHL